MTTNTTDVKTREIVITRMFNAPLKLVWKAWTDHEHFKKWWGPKDYTSPSCMMDFRKGGKYLFCMKGPEGQEYYNGGTFTDIVPMKKISLNDGFADAKGNRISPKEMGMPGDGWPDEFQITVTFEEVNGKTKMTLTQTGIPDGVMIDMTNVGWNESFDKLEVALKSVGQ